MSEHDPDFGPFIKPPRGWRYIGPCTWMPKRKWKRLVRKREAAAKAK